MALDPAKWRHPVQLAVLGTLVAFSAIAHGLGPTSTLAIAALLVSPALVGALIWRFDGLPWVDIASWTVPLAGWMAVALWIVPGPIRWLVAGVGAAAWLYAFIFWSRIARWWYRWLLRKPYPGSGGSPGGELTDQALQSLLTESADLPYPKGCAGEAIDGVELVSLDADIFGVAFHYLHNAKPITDQHRTLLRELMEKVDRVWAKLPSDEARIFYGKARAIGEYLVTVR